MLNRFVSGARLVCAIVLAVRGSIVAQSPAPPAPDLSALKYRYIGPVGNRLIAITGVPGIPTRYYAGAASGGVWKTIDGGAHWQPHIRRPGRLSRSARSRSRRRSEHRLGRNRRTIHPQQHLARQGYLQVDRRRQVVVRMGLEQTGRIARIDRRPDEPGRRRCLRVRPRVRAATGARRLPHDRRRQDLGPRPVRGRKHRLLGSRHGSEQPAHPVRRHVADRDPHVGTHERRAGQRDVHDRPTAGRPGNA